MGYVRPHDFLTLGTWLTSNYDYKEAVGKEISDIFNIATYVVGGDPFRNNMSSIIGTATYSGSVHGYIVKPNFIAGSGSPNYDLNDPIHNSVNDSRDVSSNYLFARISLMADFDNQNSLGSISGYVDNFTTVKRRNSLSGRLNLERSDIGNSHSGFFDGNVSGTVNGLNYEGKWGGQFYGNDETDGKPGTVAGTAAAATNDGNLAIYFPWAADKD